MNQIKAIEALNNEVKYERIILEFFFENQEEIRRLVETENVSTKEIEDFIEKVTTFYRKSVLVDFDCLLCTIDLDDIKIINVGESKNLKKNAEVTNSRIRGLKKEIIVTEVDTGHYLNTKSICFDTKIKDLDEFLKSDFNKIDLLCLIINQLKINNTISYCEDNKIEINSLINELKKRNKELKEVLTLINKLEYSMIEPLKQTKFIKECESE